MKRLFLLSMTIVLFLSSCENSSKDNGNDDPDKIDPTQKTTVVFDNTNGTCAVEVYSSHLRAEDSKVVEVQAGQVSKEFEWNHGSSVPFFFTYKLNLIGINALTIDFIPEIGKDQTYIRVDADKKNTVTIPPLAQTISSPDTLMSDNSYLVIQNNSSYSISLQRGNNVLMSDNFSDTGVNPGERAHYTIKNTDSKTVSGYLINENGRPSPFPVFGTSFEAGRVYSFIYNGSSFSLYSYLDVKLANVVSGSVNDQSNKTYLQFINNNDFTVSVYSNIARNNKIVDAPVLSRSAVVQTDPNISGAVFYPNYNIVIEGVTIPYQGDIIVARVDAGKTSALPNVVSVQLLVDLDKPEFEKPLSNSAYIKVLNDANTSLSFRSGSSDLMPQGTMSTIVNEGESALYIVNAGYASNYSFMRNTVSQMNFPANVTQFEAGRLYSFRFDGANIFLLTEKPLTLKQALALSPPETISARNLPNGHIALNWSKVNSETSYRIYRADADLPDNFSAVGTSVETSFTDNSVVFGKTYHYKIASVKTNLESSMSTNKAIITSEYAPLPAPTGLTAKTDGMYSIQLSWNEVDYAVSYKVYRGFSADDINTSSGTPMASTYTVSGLEMNTTYYFKVIAVGEFIESNPSNIVNAKTYDYLYTVTFNSKGGSSVINQTIERGSLVNEPANPTRSGYNFGGWYKEEACINQWNFTSDTVTGDITLYASWNLVEMVWINAGTYTRGSSNSLDNNASPPHQVILTKGFWMGKYEVTQEQYLTVIGYNLSSFSSSPASGEVQGKRPVENVTWYDAVEFCNKLSEMEGRTQVYTITGRTPSAGYPITDAIVTADWNVSGYRLPTEAEWEYACRAGSATAWHFGDNESQLGNYAWYSTNSGSRTHQAGLKLPNAWGLYDMHGNVWEWCWDWYGTYASGSQTDPKGALSGSNRVRRGGSWYGDGQFLRSAGRYYGDPGLRVNNIGFRLLRP